MHPRVLFFLIILLSHCSAKNQGTEADEIPSLELTEQALDFLNVPSGFDIEIVTDIVPGARQMVVSSSGTIFVGTRKTGEDGKVYAIIDENKDFKADTVLTIASGLRMPNGVALDGRDLYVAEVSKIWRFEDIEEHLDQPKEPILISDAFPTETSHGWKYISFGPDGKLYVPVGAPCNVCNHEDSNPMYASITRMNKDGSDLEIIAKGVRNTVGFTWHPETQNLWFTDNGRDWLGDNIPPCELNELTEAGQHFGFPFLHGSNVIDPEFGETAKEIEFKKPIQELGPHVAPLGIIFYTGEMFPEQYKNQALIAEHGSWNRSEKIGYRITMVSFNEQGEATSYQSFITGWLQSEDDIRGRPVSLVQLEDGSVLISDDYSGTIYRITYTG